MRSPAAGQGACAHGSWSRVPRNERRLQRLAFGSNSKGLGSASTLLVRSGQGLAFGFVDVTYSDCRRASLKHYSVKSQIFRIQGVHNRGGQDALGHRAVVMIW